MPCGGAAQPPFGGSLAEPDRGAEAVPEAANDASRGSAVRTGAASRDFPRRIRDSGRLGWLLLGLALVAAIVLVVAEFSTVSYRTIGIGACADRVGADKCRTIGHDAHAYSLLILALAGLLMAWGAVVGRSRAASYATAAIGIAVLIVALVIDLPDLGDKRGLEQLYNNVRPHTGWGFRLELLGGVLLLLVGGLAVGRLAEEEERELSTAAAAPDDEGPGDEPPADKSPDSVPEPEAYRPRTTAREKERERSRQRRQRRRKPRES
jgi:hypothetical protein